MKTRRNFEIGPQGVIQVPRVPLGVRINVAGTPHRTEFLFGYWHINDKDEIIISLPPPAPDLPSYLVIVMGFPHEGETDRMAWYCEKCTSLVFMSEHHTGLVGFNTFWRWERAGRVPNTMTTSRTARVPNAGTSTRSAIALFQRATHPRSVKPGRCGRRGDGHAHDARPEPVLNYVRNLADDKGWRRQGNYLDGAGRAPPTNGHTYCTNSAMARWCPSRGPVSNRCSIEFPAAFLITSRIC